MQCEKSIFSKSYEKQMKKFSLVGLSFMALAASLVTTPSHADIITTIQNTPTIGAWSNYYSDKLEIVNVTGQGGDLETNAPVGKGVLKMQTTATSDSRSEVVNLGFHGTVGSFISDGALSYNYYQQSGGPSSSISPAFKFEVLDFTPLTGSGYSTFVFEPFYNGGIGAFDIWHSVTLDLSTALFWNTGIYDFDDRGIRMTLAAWDLFFSGSLADALMTSVSFGIGSGTPGQTSYIDGLEFRNSIFSSLSADFDAPAPSQASFLNKTHLAQIRDNNTQANQHKSDHVILFYRFI